MAACAFGKQGVFGVQLHAELKVISRRAVFAKSYMAGGHTSHCAAVGVQNLCRREARENIDAQIFGLLRHPLDHIAQRHHIAAVVVEIARHQPAWRGGVACFRKDQQFIAGDRLQQGRAECFPIGKQFVHGARVHHGPRKNMRAGLRAFFNHHHRHVFGLRGGLLFDADGGSQTGGTAADNDHVVIHGLARTVLFKPLSCCHISLKSLSM